MTAASSGALKVTQVRSEIGAKPKHRRTLRALGLRGLGRSHIVPDRPEIRGMLSRVPHLVVVEPADPAEGEAQKARAQSVRQAHRVAEGRSAS